MHTSPSVSNPPTTLVTSVQNYYNIDTLVTSLWRGADAVHMGDSCPQPTR